MKKIILYFLLLMVVPATAQSSLFGKESQYNFQPPVGQPSQKPLIDAGQHSNPKNSRNSNERLGMNPRDYEEVVRVISKENFDETRLNTAKRMINVNPMSTRQIVDICKLFTFEANRLEFAKYAYIHCVDPNKYFLVNEVFTFDSSKKELDDYIRH